jgi:hypothetical protein
MSDVARKGLIAASESGIIVSIAERRIYMCAFPYENFVESERASVPLGWTAHCICFVGERLIMCGVDPSYRAGITVWTSDDFGSTWNAVLRVEGPPPGHHETRATLAVGDADTVFMRFGGRVVKSVDRCASWTMVHAAELDTRDIVFHHGSVLTLQDVLGLGYFPGVSVKRVMVSQTFLVRASGRVYAYISSVMYVSPLTSEPAVVSTSVQTMTTTQPRRDEWSRVDTDVLPYGWRASTCTIPMSIMGHIAILNPAKEGPGSMVYAIDVRDGKWKPAGECALLCAARGLFRPGAAQEAASRICVGSGGAISFAAAAPPADLDVVDALGRSAAHAAAAENRAADLMALIGMGANLDRADFCGKKPLHYVETNVETMCGIVRMSHDRQEFLFRPILSKGRMMLHWAARFAHEEIIDIILGTGVEKRQRISNAVDDDGSTPLHIACKSNRLHIAAKLIRDGHASKLVADKKGRIPFQLLDPHALKVLKAAMR